MARRNYLNNRDLLLEIHKSKLTFCEYLDDKHLYHDVIVNDLSEINSTLIKETLEEKANKITRDKRAANREEGIKETVEPIDPETLLVDDLVFRVMTFEHVPKTEERIRKAKTSDQEHTKCNFPPFKHYILENFRVNRLGNYTDLEFKEVLRSHWEGGFDNGHFVLEKGKISEKLARMFMLLVSRNGMKGNWRNYTYNDEMQGQALLQLSQVGLQFNEAKSSNPFSYYTETVNHSFTRILNNEKKGQKIRDDILIASGASPSYTRQVENDMELKKLGEEQGWAKPLERKPGRPGRKPANKTIPLPE